jgi:hypothetical protein
MDPISDFVILGAQFLEEGQYLLVEVGFGESDAGMSLPRVPRAPIVNTIALTVLGLLRLSFPCDRMTAVAACAEVASAREFVRPVNLSAKQRLNSIKRLTAV